MISTFTKSWLLASVAVGLAGSVQAADATARYVRLTVTDWPKTTNSEADLEYEGTGLAIAEFKLRKAGADFAWPAGTTITAAPDREASTNQHAAKMIDGSLDASNSKYYYNTNPEQFVFTFTSPTDVSFDGYSIYAADQDGRNPLAWKLEASDDGTTWTEIGTETLDIAGINGWNSSSATAQLKSFEVKNAFGEPLSEETVTIDATTSWDADPAPTADIVTINCTADATLTIDAALAAKTIKVTGAGKLTLVKGDAGSLDAVMVYDFSAAATTSVNFSTGAATVVAGADTILTQAGTGALTIAADKQVTLDGIKWDDAKISKAAGGTLAYKGTVDTFAVPLTTAGFIRTFDAGTFTDVTMGATATQSTVNFNAGADVSFIGDNALSLGTATTNIADGATIKANKFRTGDGGSDRQTTVTQAGGNIILTGTADGSATGSAPVMFGHWGGSGKTTYTMNGGSLVAENGGMRISNDSQVDLTLNGGRVRVKGVKGKGTQATKLVIAGGALEIGDLGFDNIANLTVALNSGSLSAYGNATVNKPMVMGGDFTFAAEADKTLTLAGAITGTGNVTIGAVEKTGAVTLMGDVTNAVTVETGATLNAFTAPVFEKKVASGATSSNFKTLAVTTPTGATTPQMVGLDQLHTNVDSDTVLMDNSVLEITGGFTVPEDQAGDYTFAGT